MTTGNMLFDNATDRVVQEKYFCCKPEWFVKQCKLVKVVSDDHEQTVRTVEDTTYEEVDRTSLSLGLSLDF